LTSPSFLLQNEFFYKAIGDLIYEQRGKEKEKEDQKT